MSALLAHRSEQQPAEAPDAAGTDDEQVGIGARVEERPARNVADEPTLDRCTIALVGDRPRQQLLECGRRVPLSVVGLEHIVAGAVVLAEKCPCQHRRE